MLKTPRLLVSISVLILLNSVACGKKDEADEEETKVTAPKDVIFGTYTTTTYTESKFDCADPTEAVTDPDATFELEALPDGVTGKDTVWYKSTARSGRFSLDTNIAAGVWTGTPTRSLSGFGKTCLLGYTDQTATLVGTTLTMEDRRYTGDVTITEGDCMADGLLARLYTENRGKLACTSREILVATKTP